MQVAATNMTIAQFFQEWEAGVITVDNEYQRGNVWPPAARSYLIDTILTGYPIPKLSLSQSTNLTTRRTTKAIVDGQQRSNAIREFLNDTLRISTTGSEYRGKKFSQLDEVDQHRFLNYQLNIDLLTGASEDDVREIFRRMNWYTAPANNQERRHSKFYGEFKVFIVHMARSYDSFLLDLGTFKKRNINRMDDAEFLTECVYAYLCGIDNVTAKKLDDLYREREIRFPELEVVNRVLNHAFQCISEMHGIQGTAMVREYNLYSLVTALMHLSEYSPALEEFGQGAVRLPLVEAVDNLIRLATAIDDGETEMRLRPFKWACSGATNRTTQRTIRLHYICAALTTGDFNATYDHVSHAFADHDIGIRD